jgi:hypothetical protein
MRVAVPKEPFRQSDEEIGRCFYVCVALEVVGGLFVDVRLSFSLLISTDSRPWARRLVDLSMKVPGLPPFTAFASLTRDSSRQPLFGLIPKFMIHGYMYL